MSMNQPLLSTVPDSYRILFLHEEKQWFGAIQEAFQKNALYHALSSPDEGREISSHELIQLVHVEEWPQVEERIIQGIEARQPFSLGVVEIGVEECDRSRRMIEQLWEIDPSLHWICCLPRDTEQWESTFSLSRPLQWMRLRSPILQNELIQLVWMWAGNFVRNVRWGFVQPSSADAKGPSSAQSGIGAGLLDENQTHLELAREELASSKIYVDNILRSMADALFVIDADLTIGAVNPALLNLLGYQEEDLVGQSPGCIFGEEFARGVIIENLMLQGSVSGVESSFLTREGSMIPISVSGSLLQNDQGQFQGMVCVAQDITERKRMEEEKQKLHEQLLDTSRQLGMAEVASDVLHNVGNVLNSINVSIGVVSDIITKSLVTDVKRVSQLLAKYDDDLGAFFTDNPKGKQIPEFLKQLSEQLLEEQRLALEELGRLRENTGQAQHCVADQQELAKHRELTEAIVLSDLVEEALKKHQGDIERFNISVIREWQDLPELLIDKHQVLEIISDVIENACQAMESVDLRELTLRVKQVNGPPDSARVEIQDTGVGIPPEDLTRIFGQGYSTKEHTRGSSLHTGALVAKNLGGALSAHSNGKDCGALFALDLPGNFHWPDL